MLWGNDWILITIIAVLIDIVIGEFPIKHPVQYMGDFIKLFQKIAYKNSIFRGFILMILLVFIVGFIAISIQTVVLKLPAFPATLMLGMLASSGLSSKALKHYVKKVVLSANDEEKRANLSLLVSRNTKLLDEKKVYSSLLESYSENMSDGIVSPLFYLMLFGFPGIMVYKTVSTLDSMIGYKNEKYEKFGKVSAITDDILNFIPARITAFIIWLLSKEKISWGKLVEDAKIYSTSPNAGYPVAAAAYNLGIILGGPVYYGNDLVNKAEIGQEKTENYEQAVHEFFKVHLKLELIILFTLTLFLAVSMLIKGS